MGRGLFLMIVFAFVFIPLLKADILSVNSGGSGNITMIPDTYIEGFFSTFPYCGNGVIDGGEQCDGSNLNGATCATQGFSSGTLSCSSSCTFDTSSCASAAGTGGTSGGGGAPSGGSGVYVSPKTLTASPTEFNINLAVNTNVERLVTITNVGSSAVNLSISQTNLDGMIILGANQILVAPGESNSFSVVFVALNETGIFTGKIKVGSLEIPVSLNVKTKLLLFDSNIVVLNKDYLVQQGDDLKTQVTLIPLGDKERLDVTLHYVVKDYDGKVYLTKSETLLVEKQINFKRNFDTGILPVGKYVVGLELVYPNGVAPSSAHFEVIPRKFSFGNIVYYLVIAILIIGILILAILIYSWIKKRREENS